jgi:hypothetical protein
MHCCGHIHQVVTLQILVTAHITTHQSACELAHRHMVILCESLSVGLLGKAALHKAMQPNTAHHQCPQVVVLRSNNYAQVCTQPVGHAWSTTGSLLQLSCMCGHAACCAEQLLQAVRINPTLDCRSGKDHHTCGHTVQHVPIQT